MGQLEDLRAFVQIVEQQSIGKAAAAEGIAKSAMSRKLSKLETHLQTKLIARSTRQWALTEAGRLHYERGLTLLNQFDEFDAQARCQGAAISGTIRLSVPHYFGKQVLNTPLLDFAQAHPEIHLKVHFSDRFVDVINENYDLVIRIAQLPGSNLIAKKLCQTQHLLCASPSYIATAPALRQPEDLKQHRIIHYGDATRFSWQLDKKIGRAVQVQLRAAINSDGGDFLLHAAESGFGVARLPDFMAREAIAAGRLKRVLPSYHSGPMGVHAVYAASSYLPARVRLLLDQLAQALAAMQ